MFVFPPLPLVVKMASRSGRKPVFSQQGEGPQHQWATLCWALGSQWPLQRSPSDSAGFLQGPLSPLLKAKCPVGPCSVLSESYPTWGAHSCWCSSSDLTTKCLSHPPCGPWSPLSTPLSLQPWLSASYPLGTQEPLRILPFTQEMRETWTGHHLQPPSLPKHTVPPFIIPTTALCWCVGHCEEFSPRILSGKWDTISLVSVSSPTHPESLSFLVTTSTYQGKSQDPTEVTSSCLRRFWEVERLT